MIKKFNTSKKDGIWSASNSKFRVGCEKIKKIQLKTYVINLVDIVNFRIYLKSLINSNTILLFAVKKLNRKK